MSESSSKKNVIVNLRINSDLKNESGEILKKNDLDHSKAVRLFLEYIVKLGGIPDFIKRDF